MKNDKALVTLALGGRHQHTWRTYCERNWRAYAEKQAYDLIFLDKPLDSSDRAAKRSPSWQKCLILNQEWSQEYERVVWVDADILINNATAPSIVSNVPLDKIGAVAAYSNPSRNFFIPANRRNAEYWKKRGATVDIEDTPSEFYANWGLPASGIDEVVQAGVLVLSPHYHRELLSEVYARYEDKGVSWQYEMRPLSYELLRANSIYWIDIRFNYLWMIEKLLHYPFLFNLRKNKSLIARMRRRVGKELGIFSAERLIRACATTAYLNSYFLHFAASLEDISYVNMDVNQWQDISLVEPSRS